MASSGRKPRRLFNCRTSEEPEEETRTVTLQPCTCSHSEQVKSIKPYQFEPKPKPGKINGKKNEVVSTGHARPSPSQSESINPDQNSNDIDNGDSEEDEEFPVRQFLSAQEVGKPVWCKCDYCEYMTDEKESLCCLDLENSKGVKRTTQECITHHEGFRPICLNKNVLKMSLVRNNRGTQQTQENEDVTDRSLRFTAYMNFIHWYFGRLGPGNRTPIPSCVVSQIRRSFPGDGIYVGFLDSIE